MSTQILTKAVHPELEKYCAEFPILSRKIYLNTVSLGALSRRSIEATQEFLDIWAARGASAWYDTWMAKLQELRAQFARLIGAKPHEIALAPSVSVALSSVASALDYSKRKKVILTELDFPTDAYQWAAKARQGVRVQLLPTDDRIRIALDRFEQAIDRETALVVTGRVFFTSGYIQDIKRIAEMAHAKDAYVFIDDYQGTGQLSIDVKDAGIDFLVSGGLKWLLGGPGIAFLYVREGLIEKLEPTITGWFGAANQFDFDVHHFGFKHDAGRFELGTPALAPVYAASAGLEIIEEIGVWPIRERSRWLTTDLIARARERGWCLRTPEREEERAAIVMIEMDDPAKVVQALAHQDIIVDYRPGALRASPYFYNTIEENEAVASAIETALATA
jgi:kynureninase